MGHTVLPPYPLVFSLTPTIATLHGFFKLLMFVGHSVNGMGPNVWQTEGKNRLCSQEAMTGQFDFGKKMSSA